MSLSTLDKIKLKTHQILIKTDDYFTTTKNGMDAGHHGVMFGAVSIIAGITGVAAIVTTAPTLPFISAVAALASIPTFAVGGATVNLAGATLLSGGTAGLAFTAFAKMYKAVKGDRDYEVNGEFECWPKGSDGSPNSLVRVSRKEILKSIENSTFSDKYDAVQIENFSDPSAPFKLKMPKKESIEVVGSTRFQNSHYGMVESIASQPYLLHDKVVKPSFDSWIEDSIKVRRECFKEAKTFDLKASIMNRISHFREKLEGETPSKKYTV